MEDQPIKHHTYFEGRVQSLGLQTENGNATVGVMKAGKYVFNTASAEKMVILSGTLTVSLDGLIERDYTANEHFDIEANSSFVVNCDDDVAYICYYA